MKISRAVSAMLVCLALTGCKVTITTGLDADDVSSTSSSSAVNSDTGSKGTSSTVTTGEITTEDINNAEISIGDIIEKDDNKQYSVTYNIKNGAVIFTETMIFDSSDKFVGAIKEIDVSSGVTFDNVISVMSMEDEASNFKGITDNKFVTEVTKDGYATDGPMFNNGIKYSYDSRKEIIEMFKTISGDDTEFSFNGEYSGHIDFSDVEIIPIGESSEVVSTIEESTGGTLNFISEYDETDIIDLDTYSLTIKAGEEVEVPIKSMPAGDVTCTLKDNSCATLIYSNNTLKVKGIANGFTTLNIEASNGKIGSIIINIM